MDLRMLIANLERSRSSFHWWLEFFTALVAIGVVLEIVFVIWEYLEELHDFRRGIGHPPERPSVWLLLFGLFGASLVAVGVAGEYLEEARLESVETQIRRADDELYLLLSKEAGDAAISAKEAREEANAVKITSSQARAWVLHFKPRYTSMDRKKFVETLNGVPPEKVEILYERENEEAYTFASVIALALGPGNGNAGWSLSGPRPAMEKDALPSLSKFYAHPENVPLILRVGGKGGCGIIAKSVHPNPGKGAIGASALNNALANSGALGVLQMYEDPSMPVGFIRIVIGKQFN